MYIHMDQISAGLLNNKYYLFVPNKQFSNILNTSAEHCFTTLKLDHTFLTTYILKIIESPDY